MAIFICFELEFGSATRQLQLAKVAGAKTRVGGLQGTFQNLGTSFGTAVVGPVFMLMLTSGFVGSVQGSPDLSDTAKTEISAKAQTGVQIVSGEQAYDHAVQEGGNAQAADTISGLYEASHLQALKEGLFV